MSAPVYLPNMDFHRIGNPKLFETLTVIQNSLKPTTQAAPPQVSGIAVTAQNGWFTVTLTDNGNVNSGIHYWFEWSLTPDFQRPIPIDNGGSRVLVISLGNQTIFWRAFSQYLFPFSPPNAPIVFGGATPTGVPGGGAVAPPAVASTGSGTASTAGTQGGYGFGKQTVRQGPTRL